MAIPSPATMFPDSYSTGKALMDKVDTSSPDTVCLGKEDGEKYLLYVASSTIKALHTLTTTMESLFTGEDTEDKKNVLREAIHPSLLALANVQHQCCLQSKRYDGDFIDVEMECAISPPYDFTADDNIDTVNDQALRNAGTFSGSVPDSPELLQSFLRSLYDIGRTSRLSESCMVKLVQRRTLSTARVLVDNFLASLPDTSQPGTLLKLVLYLERNFSLSWAPDQCKASLAHLPQKFRNTKNFAQLQARILQLSQLASLSEREEDRPAYLKANQLPVFMAALSKEDQDLLLRLETQRRSQALPSLDLSSAVKFLLQHHAARNVTAAELSGKSDSITPQTSHDSALMTQQGLRPRRRRADSAPPRRLEGRQRSASSARPPPSRLVAQDSAPKKEPIWQKYQVPRGACIQCSSTQHRLNDPACPYKGTGNPLPPSACRYPGCKESGRGGGHWAEHCRTRAQVNQSNNAPAPLHPGGPSSRGRGSRPSSKKERFSRGGRSSAARRLAQPERALQAQEEETLNDGNAFFFED